MATLRVLSWNIAAARLSANGSPAGAAGAGGLDAVVGVLREADADLVALQEVDRSIARSGHVDQPACLAEALGMACRFAPTLTSDGGVGPWRHLDAPGQDPGGPGYGIALLTRLPLEDVEPLPLPHASPGQEPRVALVAAVRVGGRTVTVAATHLDRHPDAATPQLGYLQERLGGRPGPRVLLGDLNLRASRVEAVNPPDWRLAVRGRTHPAGWPTRQVDHVLLDSPSLQVRSARVVATRASDHRPIAVEVELAG